MQRPRRVAIFPVGRDKRRDGNGVTVSKEFCDLGDASDVFIAVRFAEAKILVQAEADVVAIKAVSGQMAESEEVVFEFDGDGRFTRGREAGEPDCEAALAS